MNTNPSILFLIPNKTLNKVFVDHAKKMGFDVHDLFDAEIGEYQHNFADKMMNIFSRVVLKDKEYLQRRKKNHYIKGINELGNKKLNRKYEYAFFIRADSFPEQVVEKARSVAGKMVTYQSDGLSVSPNLEKIKKYFDRVLVFDRNDLDAHSDFLPITNCWFPDDYEKTEPQFDLFYVGVGVPDRLEIMKNLDHYCRNENIKLKAFLTIQQYHQEEKTESVSLVHQPLTYDENMKFVKSSKAIIDFKLPYHNGLSFRFFEALNYRKKLITNNTSVRNYDFYHPNNIFITDFHDFSGIEDFLQLPYQEIDEQIRTKYGFENWIRYALDLQPHQKIILPKP